jgi:cytochrome c biogenesis protein CcdA
VSSIAVVAAYTILNAFLGFSLPYINIIAGIALIILAVRFFIEKPKDEFGENHGHLHDDFEGGEHIHEHSHHDIGIHTHKHKHARKLFLSLTGVAVFAFVLGFAHEEEFVLLAFAVAGIDPLPLMLTYAAAVMMALIGITLMTVKVYSKMEEKMKKYENLIPKISGMILLVTAVSFFLNLR